MCLWYGYRPQQQQMQWESLHGYVDIFLQRSRKSTKKRNQTFSRSNVEKYSMGEASWGDFESGFFNSASEEIAGSDLRSHSYQYFGSSRWINMLNNTLSGICFNSETKRAISIWAALIFKVLGLWSGCRLVNRNWGGMLMVGKEHTHGHKPKLPSQDWHVTYGTKNTLTAQVTCDR